MTRKENYLRRNPWAIVEIFLHEKYGDCAEDNSAGELRDELKKYGWKISALLTPADKRRDELGYVPKDDPRLDTIIGPPRTPEQQPTDTSYAEVSTDDIKRMNEYAKDAAYTPEKKD